MNPRLRTTKYSKNECHRKFVLKVNRETNLNELDDMKAGRAPHIFLKKI